MKSEDEGRPMEPSSYQLQPPVPPEPTPHPSARPVSPSAVPPQPGPAGAAQGPGEGPEDGRVLAGRYRLLRRLGRGGMGTVWRAHDQLVGREVAVKEPWVPGPVPEGERQTVYARMRREARTAANIHHPSVVTIHDVVIEDERPWIVMELIQGQPLSELLDRGPLSETEGARVGLAVLGALVAAHRHQVLHRDVKPSNVLIGADDRVVLTDFGIAKVEGEQGLTQAGAFVGSPTYTAPERVLGQAPGPPSDLWSLGVLLYAAVEGVSPFQRSNAPATLHAVLNEEPPTPSRVSGAFATLIIQLLRKEPSARPDPEVVHRVLTEVVQRDPGPAQPLRPAVPEAHPVGPFPPTPSSSSGGFTTPQSIPGTPPGPPARNPAVRRAWLGAGAVVLVAALVAGGVLVSRELGDDSTAGGDTTTGESGDPSASSSGTANENGSDNGATDQPPQSQGPADPPASPTSPGITWEVHDETDVVRGSIPAPAGYLRSEDDNEVEYSSEDGEYVFGMDHFDDAEEGAVGEANYRLDWYKNVDNYGWEKVRGWVNPTDYQGYDAARLDATFVPGDDPDARGRISELVLVDGVDHWHFYLIGPDEDEADRERSEQLFQEAVSRIVIDNP